MLHRFVILFLLFPILSGCFRDAAYYYVSPSGDDNASGRESQPIATIGKALELIRDKGKDAVIILQQGTHYLTETMTFVPPDPKIRIKAQTGEKAIVSGGILLRGLHWQPYKDGIMQAKIEQEDVVFDQLFVDGKLQISARYPNFDTSASHYNGTAANAISPERTARWKNPAGGYVHALHRHEWGGYHRLITGKDKNGELLLEGGCQNNRRMGMHDKHRFVENIFEELDAPGEWYFDASKKRLYFYPPKGVDLTTARIETPQLRELFVMQGYEDNPVRNISIEGVELTHTLRTFMNTLEPLLRSDWTIYRGGTVRMEGAEDCVVKDCYFNTVGGNAVFFSNYNRRNTVSGCRIERAGASGVCFVGDPRAVRSPSFEYNEFVDIRDMDFTPGPIGNNFPAQCLVCDNLMCDLGRTEKQTAGVQISMSRGITVSHNTIYDVPRAGINIGDGTWGGHVIEYNDVFNTVLETGDHGSFNSWGRDRWWHPKRDSMNRRVESRPDLILLDAVETVVIRNNRFRCDHGWDIDLDDGSSNYHISNNVCLNGGIKLREGFYRTVENNIMINNSFHPHVWFRNSEDVFKHNIVTTPYFPIRVNDWGKDVDDNFFPDEASLKKAQTAGTDVHSAAGSPEFADPKTGDYRVKKTSGALKVGFKNFDQDNFGVVSANLRSIAKKPPIPELIDLSDQASEAEQIFMSMRLKTITTLGERSAAGLSEISGVQIIEVLPGGELAGLLQADDIILSFNNQKIRNIKDLKEARIAARKRASIIISRNQKEENIVKTY